MATSYDPTLLTYEQLLYCKERIIPKQVAVVERGGGQWNYWGESFTNSYPTIDRAGKYSVEELLKQHFHHVLYQVLEPDFFNCKPELKADRVLLPIAQLEEFLNNNKEVGTKLCRPVVKDWTYSGMYWRSPIYSGVTWDPEQAMQMQVKSVLSKYYNSSCLVEVLDEELARKIQAAPFRKVHLENVIPSAFINQLQQYPNNPTYRSLLMAKFGVMPPAEITTFHELKDWVEYKCEPPAPENAVF